jgi:hypothetical protein
MSTFLLETCPVPDTQSLKSTSVTKFKIYIVIDISDKVLSAKNNSRHPLYENS